MIRAGSFVSVNDLVRDIKAYLKQRNADPKPYVWQAAGAESSPRSNALAPHSTKPPLREFLGAN